MAELRQQERLQPSLLDRLTDEEPDKKQESRDSRVLSLRRLREAVMRDLSWLCNCGNLETTEDLEPYPEVARSVLNFGVRDLSGQTTAGIDEQRIARQLRQAILDFEPRILRKALNVRVEAAADRMSGNALTFYIEGELWAQPVPMHLFLRTDVDLETGSVNVTSNG